VSPAIHLFSHHAPAAEFGTVLWQQQAWHLRASAVLDADMLMLQQWVLGGVGRGP